MGNQAWWQQMDLTAALLVSAAAAVWRVDKRIISREFDYAYYVFPSPYWAPPSYAFTYAMPFLGLRQFFIHARRYVFKRCLKEKSFSEKSPWGSRYDIHNTSLVRQMVWRRMVSPMHIICSILSVICQVNHYVRHNLSKNYLSQEETLPWNLL